MQSQDTKRIRLFQTTRPGVSRVGLQLNGKTLIIGKLDRTGEGSFTSTKKSKKHLFRQGKALGVNLELLQSFDFRWVRIQFCDELLTISREELLENGIVLSFEKSGFEPQCFLPLDRWHRSIPGQGNLFDTAA